MGLLTTDAFDTFRANVEQGRKDLLEFLHKANAEGKSVYALGASTKGNVLLQYFSLDSTLIKGVGEVNSEKLGAFTPGSLIPIVSEDEILQKNPDYILILPWHFRNFFTGLAKLKGTKLVFPLPSLGIVSA